MCYVNDSPHKVRTNMHVCFYAFLRVCPTYSLWGENLCEPGREGDEDHRVGDPRQILKEDVAIQATVHPFLCCGHTHTYEHVNTHTLVESACSESR